MEDKIIDWIDEMLKSPARLAENELRWVRQIDKTMAQFSNPSPTPRQGEVIISIYKNFRSR